MWERMAKFCGLFEAADVCTYGVAARGLSVVQLCPGPQPLGGGDAGFRSHRAVRTLYCPLY